MVGRLWRGGQRVCCPPFNLLGGLPPPPLPTPMTVIGNASDRVLGRQPFCIVLDRSTAQVCELLLHGPSMLAVKAEIYSVLYK